MMNVLPSIDSVSFSIEDYNKGEPLDRSNYIDERLGSQSRRAATIMQSPTPPSSSLSSLQHSNSAACDDDDGKDNKGNKFCVLDQIEKLKKNMAHKRRQQGNEERSVLGAALDGAASSIGGEVAATATTGPFLSEGRPARRRSSALSVESDGSGVMEDLADVDPDHEALAKYNADHRSTWVEFARGGSQQLGDSAGSAASELWGLGRGVKHAHHRQSWLDLDEDDFDDELELDWYGGEVEARQPEKKVRFGGPSENTHYLHVARSDYTERELHLCWYDEYDHEELQIELIETVRALRKPHAETEGERRWNKRSNDKDTSSSADASDLCSRGIEHIVDPTLFESRRVLKERYVDAVLAEQEALDLLRAERNGEDIPDADAIVADAAMEASEEARAQAAQRGESDAAAARMIRTRARRSRASLENLIDLARGLVLGSQQNSAEERTQQQGRRISPLSNNRIDD